MTSFWNANVGISAQPAIPTANITGTSDGNSEQNLEDVHAFHPILPYLDENAEVVSFLPSPIVGEEGELIDLAEVDLQTMTPDTFLGLHLAHQLELLLRNGGSLTLDEGGDGRLDVVAGPDGSSVFVLQQLSTTEITLLNGEEQSRIKAHLDHETFPADYRAYLANAWGVSMSGSELADLSDAAALITAAIGEVNETDLGLYGTAKDLYIDQLELLQAAASEKSLFSLSGLNDEIAALMERFERVEAYAIYLSDNNQRSITLAESNSSYGWSRYHYSGQSSLDSNKVIVDGLESFIAQEERILLVKQQRWSLVQNSAGMDLGTLIAALQMTYNIQKEAEVTILTEELQQQNALLRDYAEIQRMVNDVLKEFKGDNVNEQTRNYIGTQQLVADTIDNETGESESGLSMREVRAVRMFSTDKSGAALGSSHPIEVLRGIERPLQNQAVVFKFEDESDPENSKAIYATEYETFTQSAWNIFSTQLADAVTMINQESQILTNEISSMNQQQNRHFDISNSSLRRMSDLVTQIGRS
ncbi:hypothetical protein [Labrenzia sp. OB1]|uniref:hypothetical protein n=1 Tax=Labrenzia sp. OB1 TaxID=1561204 RepID=UPI0007B1BB42|nr:hypothetical protein [Labrenzia sp. OB1]KZM47362.1 hypothetical protein OA90_26435 [Labrenzia sp. OB1]